MNYNDFLNLPEIKKRNSEPGDAGILIINKENAISNNIDLGKTRNEIKKYLKNLFPGLDEETINEFTNEAINQKLDKKQLEDSAKKSKNGLILESMDTSAIDSEKTINNENKSFSQQTPTPLLNKTDIEKKQNYNDGPEK